MGDRDRRLSRRSFVSAGSALAAASQAGALAGPRPTENKVRIGVVGGRFGSTFKWNKHPRCEVTAVCDLRKDRQQTLSEVYRTDAVFSDYGEMLRRADLDAVAVFTPAPLHADMSIQALEAGKHIISAVPAGFSIEELERLIDAVKRSGLEYMMAETTTYRPQIITCREWAAAKMFGEVFYAESEYHHNLPHLLWDERGKPTWRYGMPPMFYITHQTSAIVPVMGSRLTEVQAVGWGDGSKMLRDNAYGNPFWNTTGFFKTADGRASRISVFKRSAAGFAQRSQFYGSKRSYVMGRIAEDHPDTVMTMSDEELAAWDGPGRGRGHAEAHAADDAAEKHWDKLPEPLRIPTGHAGSHSHIIHEFISAITEGRRPLVDVWEAAAYTAPGLIAHESALKGGEVRKIPDLGKAG